ncbi:MAG: autotransporter domain-containing protein [Candidatus Omnitrophica bacterium]|nr:autotransporter domain-containing protein [Candidatus Omnitrophota bacterium]
MPNLKYFKLCLLTALFFLFCSIFFPAGVFAETYGESIDNAQHNIDHNLNFIPNYPGSGNKAIITIQGNPASENSAFGLTYDTTSYGDNYLIVRTFSKSRNSFDSSTQTLTGVGNYTTYGSPSSAASWVTTGNDTTNFLDGNSVTSSNVVDLMERGLGMNNNASHDIVVEYAVLANNNNLMRPTNMPDIKAYSVTSGDYTFGNPFNPTKPDGMSDSVYASMQIYLNAWQKAALGKNNWHGLPDSGSSNQFPWTELGYTYFWNSGGTDLAHVQGESEFIILGGTAVKIYGLYSAQSYIYTKNKNGVLSTDADAQYGNGFGSFNITGDCDTVWAGNAFQKRTSTSASSPNEIIIASGATMSGGQGILVWSLNYTITNRGTITGTTKNKLYYDATHTGLTGTGDVAILFKGDTSYGSITGGINEVLNYGTISSPGTAIKIEKGNSIINNTGGTITGATAIEISGGTTLLINNGTINGGLTLTAGTTAALDIGTGSVSLSSAGVYTQGSGTTLNLTANSSSVFGKVAATGAAASVDAASKVNVTINGYIPNNTTFANVISSTGAGVNVPTTIMSSSPIFTFTGANGTGDHLDLTVTRANSYNSLATDSKAQATGTVLNAIALSGTASGDMATVLGSLDSLTSANQINTALNSLNPDVSSGINQASNENLSLFVKNVTSHMDVIQSLHDEPKGRAVWAQGFGNYLHQDPRGSSNGYNASIWGMSAGYDIPYSTDLTFGANVGYAQDYIRTKDFSSRTRADNYQASLYGTYSGMKHYIDGILSIAYNVYNSSRQVTLGGIDRRPTADYGGEQYSTYFESGYIFEHKQFKFTPFASLQYAHLHVSGYTEKGADALNLKVKSQDYDMVQSGLGMKAAARIKSGCSTLIPEVHTQWLYEFMGDTQQTTSTFSGGGASFITDGFKPARSAWNVGTKFSLVTKDNIEFVFNYDFEAKEDFYAHCGYANVRYAF